MFDEELSEAVVTYVWGAPNRPWPSRDAGAVWSHYGGRAAHLFPLVQEIFATLDAAAMDWDHEDLAAATARIQALARTAHPELDDAAIRAIGGQFSYLWR